jgi:hypothetical protein
MTAARMIQDRPLTGIGFGNESMRILWEQYHSKIPKQFQTQHHVSSCAQYLSDVSVRLGFIGLLLFLYIVIVFYSDRHSTHALYAGVFYQELESLPDSRLHGISDRRTIRRYFWRKEYDLYLCAFCSHVYFISHQSVNHSDQLRRKSLKTS